MHRLYLSRTNILTLLAALDRDASQAAIMKNDISHPTHPTTVPTLLIAIEDHIYYASRGREALEELKNRVLTTGPPPPDNFYGKSIVEMIQNEPPTSGPITVGRRKKS